ncbi:MAG: hypothetical protein QOD09_267 [Bradyrhizobium sp.]|jgi:hypothetical protein|nr:hypothetical protein [Bradyrhizobium sp.]
MGRYRTITAIFGGLVCLTFYLTNAQAEGLGGSWSGEVSQNNPPATYPVAMQLDGSVGNTTYSSAGCGGKLEFLRTDGTSYWYKEHISYGRDKCTDGGIIEMRAHPSGDNTSWDWKWTGSGPEVTGVLRGTGVSKK